MMMRPMDDQATIYEQATAMRKKTLRRTATLSTGPDAVTDERLAASSFAARAPEASGSGCKDDMFVAPRRRPGGQPSAEALARSVGRL